MKEVFLLMNSLHTFVVLAYKESPFLEDCIMSVINQSIKTKDRKSVV